VSDQPPPPAPKPITAQEFQHAIRQPDEELNTFVKRVYDETSAPYRALLATAHRHFTKPEDAKVMDTFVKLTEVNVSLSTASHKPSPLRINYTGIHGDAPMDGNKSVAQIRGMNVTLPKDTCLGCSASKPQAPGYTCDDLSDPAQVRASQLNRAFAALHEIGHGLLPLKTVATELGKEKKEDIDPFAILVAIADVRGNERQADAFAAGLFIRYLGKEGALFVKQMAAGLRYMENGTNGDHDTSLALAKVLERYRQDPTTFTSGPLAGLMEMNVADAQEMATTTRIAATFEKLSSFSAPAFRTPDDAYQNAQQRLQDREKMQPAQQIMYDKYFRPADELMMNMTGLAENLQRLTSHSPLDPKAPLGPDTTAIVAACKVKPYSSTP